ncbi:tctex1 domain-containing protein 2-like [Octopus sinensis]|uniref:Tctex1 domain-containing protein 2-like n=1 Tax=Octopus sinensis TaxID=2607531 RepID=A0A6P7TZ86_9MOLL|nr:tctex1 domain-containing protein 2-like [Octopus sinensis]
MIMNTSNDGCTDVRPSSSNGVSVSGKRMTSEVAKPEHSLMRRSSLFVQNVERTKEISSMPSLLGLLTSKRLAKKISTRLYERRHGQNAVGVAATVTTSGVATTAAAPGTSLGTGAKHEPTYRMEPLRRFPKETSPLAVIKRTLAENLRNVEYAPKAGARLVMYLSDEIKDYVKALEFDRYKIVCYVVLGEKKDQDATVSSRCSWDDRTDGCACYTYEANSWYCTAIVYGIYKE